MTSDMAATDLHLVVGKESRVGGALLAHWQRQNWPVAATSRRHDPGCLQVDLAADPASWQLPDQAAVAVLCAAVTPIQACRDSPDETARINVAATVHLARQLAARGAFVIFLSTNQVFDGSRPYRRPYEPTRPMTEYGRQKAAAEEALLALGERIAIVRFAKILEPRPKLFVSWREALARGRPIEPFADMVMAPVSLEFAVQTLATLAAGRKGGIHHVSAERDVTYAEVARRAARLWNADGGLVRPTSARRVLAEFIPAHTTLDSDGLRGLGLPIPSVETTLREVLAAA